MTRLLTSAVALLLFSTAAQAQIISATVDLLDGADPGAPSPPGISVLDFRVDVADTDAWSSGGIRCITYNGATLIYDDGEPNQPGIQPNLVNTGSTESRYVTMLSCPRGRNNPARFDNGAVEVTGSYDPPSGTAVTEPTELSISFIADPPPAPESPSVDGYVIRIALSSPLPVQVITTVPYPPTGFGILLASITGLDDGSNEPGWVNGTFDTGTTAVGDFYLWKVPEPSSLMLVLLATPLLRRRVAR